MFGDEERRFARLRASVVWLAPPLLALVLAVLSAPVVASGLVAASAPPPGYGYANTGRLPAHVASAAALISVIAAGAAGGLAGTFVARRRGWLAAVPVALFTAWPVAIVTVPVGLWRAQERLILGYLCIDSCSPTVPFAPEPSLASLIAGSAQLGGLYLLSALPGAGFATLLLIAPLVLLGEGAEGRSAATRVVLRIGAAGCRIAGWALTNFLSIAAVPHAAAALVGGALVWAAACSLFVRPSPRRSWAERLVPTR